MKHLFVLISVCVFILSCEQNPVEIPDFVVPESDRVVLIEELSGVSCPNCPQGAAEVSRLHDVFGENLVSITYYTKFLGFPRPESKYNFLTDDADEMEDYLGSYLGKPAATFNRNMVDVPNNRRFNSSTAEWQRFTNDEISEPSSIFLDGTVSYSNDDRIVEISIDIVPNKDLEGEFRISAVLTESHIIDAQLFPNDVVDEEYEHNHIFRKLVSNLTGDALPDVLEERQRYTMDYTVDIDEEWVAENMHVVFFVEQLQNGTPSTVLQAAEKSIVE